MLVPYPVRLRSRSSPPRPHPHKPDASPQSANSQNASSPPDSSTSSPPPVLVPSSSSSPIIREGSPSMPKEKPLAVFPPPSQSRKLFRLKRPSSSSSALRPTYEREILGPSLSSKKNVSSAPPRPPRNPARASSSRRPQSSSGVIQSGKPQINTPQAPIHRSRFVMRSFLHIEPLAFPLSLQADVAVQRRNSRRKTVPPPTQPSIKEDPPQNSFQFSTADRTILEELKQKIIAKDAQFRTRNKKKHHPHSSVEVPYPTCYDRRVLDNDIWETKSFQEACGSVTWHTFDEPPLRVLDLGCGVGTWILDCARAWKDTSFVGLDIVPLHPDLQQVGSSQLASRITWVQANFLEPLPFQDEEFDYVHIKRIARGVPEDKWDALFEEISRVLKSGGALEIIEEDLYFPGSMRKSSAPRSPSHVPSLSPDPQLSERPRAPTPLSSFYSQANNGSVVGTNGTPAGFPQRPPTGARSHTEPLLPLLSRSPTEYTEDTIIVVPDDPPVRRTSDQVSHTSIPHAPVNPRDHAILEFVYDEMHAARFINLEPLSLLGNTLTLYFKDMRTHPPVIASFPPLPLRDVYSDRSRVSSGNGSYRSSPLAPHGFDSSDPNLPAVSGMHSSPTAPLERRPSVTLDTLRTGTSQFLTLDESRFDAFSPSPHASFPSPIQKSPSSPRFQRPSIDATTRLSDEPAHIARKQHSSLAFPRVSEKRKMTRLPNPRFEFDVGLLNLHLLLRVEEILACAEAMWDFVLDYQQVHVSRRSFHPSGTAPRLLVHPKMSKRPAEEPIHGALLDMTRRDFDILLSRFQFDMKDSMGLGSAVENRLKWGPVPESRSESRREFDSLCNEWARFQLDPTAYLHHPSSYLNGSTAVLSSAGTSDEDNSAFSHWDGTDSSGSNPQTNSSEKEKFRGVIVTESLARSGPSHEGKMSQEYLDLGEATQLRPFERQSRTFRVMVAWKA